MNRAVVSCGVVEGIVGDIVAFCQAHADIVAAAYLCGSYVKGRLKPLRPNVNVYFIAEPARATDLRIATSVLWREVGQSLERHRIAILIDCHPYTVTWREGWTADTTLLTITTKVLDRSAAANRYSLPPTIGNGWVANYRMLWGDERLLLPLRECPSYDIEWAQAVHEALGRYRNLLDHLPWALPWMHHPEVLREESLRYAEEAIRDSLPIALTPTEISAGAAVELFKQLVCEGGPVAP